MQAQILEFWKACPQTIKDTLAQSPSLIFVLIVAYYAYRQLANEHKAHLESKDREIERLVKEKNLLQKEILQNRLSTEDKSKSKGGKK